MNIKIIVISLILFINNALAKDIAIYRWIDKNNVVHFSQNEPIRDDYSKLTTFASYKTASKKPKKNQTSLTEQAKTQHEQLLKNEEIFDKHCKSAKLNIKMLNSFEKVLFKDEEGNNSILNDKQKQEQIEKSKKNIELYCEK